MERATQTFASDVQQLAGIRTFVRSTCERAWGAGHEEIARLELALAEAAANVMLHAYEGEAGRPIEVLVEAGPEEVRVWLYHEGRDFDPAAVATPVFDGSRESGFGGYLIKQVRGNGGDLKLCNITKFVRSTFNLMRFHRLCDLLDTREEAVKAFQQAT